MKRIINSFRKPGWGKRAGAVLALSAMTAIALPAQNFTTLFSFDKTDGGKPGAALVQGADGDFYGTTYVGGAHNHGTVFKITSSGALTTLYNFCSQRGCADGANPVGALVRTFSGEFFGVTLSGGANDLCGGGCGTVFSITPSGTLTTLYSFCSHGNCTDGANPEAGLVQAANGNFYGTTEGGGANPDGTVFEITPTGTLTTLYSFCSQSKCTDGNYPYAGLVQAASGDLYGTTSAGGANRGGTIFKITPSGTLTTVYDFCSQSKCADGNDSQTGLTLATDGALYGTTYMGGDSNFGTVFKVTPGGALTTLYSFCSQNNCTDGRNPAAGLVQATDGNFYGTTYGGVVNNYGTIFKISPGGTLTTLYRFQPTVGGNPVAALFQATNGDLYGTTQQWGANNWGTVFSLAVGLGTFVVTQPTGGNVGTVVKILGTDLAGATGVTFNGAAAVFEVVSSSEIITSVPAGATSGKVQVATSTGTLSSNMGFRVLP
jgi:uncharacterized repeat protein (TIGR03803 family)